MAIFTIGDPVVIVTDRALQGRVTSVDFRWRWIRFLPQNLHGKKGWIDSRPWDGDEPAYYQAAFRLHDHRRTVLILELHEFDSEDNRAVRMRRQQVESGWGYVRVRADDLVHDTEPVGTYEQLQEEKYEACLYFDLHPSEVIRIADGLLDSREATLRPEAFLARWRECCGPPTSSVEEMQWRLFQEEGWPSILEYIKDYIGGNGALGFDWRSLVPAVELAENGDRTALDQLGIHVSLYGTLPHRGYCHRIAPHSEPLRARWE